ncbi:CRISPR-associated protein [Leptotrichia sp. OH3620_COT-345]|uniref:type I CRISPR-associated protein Cas7 n=1 Tax=Leptotrichia sp. OH3620_COT-345 TaxID=2491048 RepID=UPI000F64A4D4|nr:type I CRISPR-associated protein Cas7 [Leptotrichia sp. OH3620_COT-345]RRD39069.1 CRISPR-associated protein [Leptotrichia sp. OH3620_COT-345]
MKTKIFGVFGIKSVMANWNADFSGYPKETNNGEIFGSDKAFKFPMKKMWENTGEKVLYIKSYKIADEKEKERVVRPKSLKERYEEIFEVEDLKKEKDQEKVLKNLFKAIDVKNFGATFAEEGNNISITGAVQIGQGFNKYEETNAEEQQILSPFRAENRKQKEEGTEADASTLGTKIVTDEAHYIYPFAITPNSYNEYVKLGVTEGYTEGDYEKFKKAALIAATSFNTNSKMGCENELGVFIEVENDRYLPDLAQYVEFEKREGGKNIIKLGFSELVNGVKDDIKGIEIYYNPYTTEVKGELEKAKYFNIFTMKEV